MNIFYDDVNISEDLDSIINFFNREKFVTSQETFHSS